MEETFAVILLFFCVLDVMSFLLVRSFVLSDNIACVNWHGALLAAYVVFVLVGLRAVLR